MSNDPNPDPRYQEIADHVAGLEDWQVLEELAGFRVELGTRLSNELREILDEMLLDR